MNKALLHKDFKTKIYLTYINLRYITKLPFKYISFKDTIAFKAVCDKAKKRFSLIDFLMNSILILIITVSISSTINIDKRENNKRVDIRYL